MNPIRRIQGSTELFTRVQLEQRANLRFEHKCKKAIALQAFMRERGYSSRSAPQIEETIDRSLKIAASIKDWEEVRSYINERCNGNEIYLCLLCTTLFLEKYDGMTKEEIKLQFQMESDEMDRRLIESIFTDDDEIDLD